MVYKAHRYIHTNASADSGNKQKHSFADAPFASLGALLICHGDYNRENIDKRQIKIKKIHRLYNKQR